MAQDWEIKARSHACSQTGKKFEEGDVFYTLLFKEKSEFRREDLCEDAFAAFPKEPAPFSFWKSKYEPPTPLPPETLPKESAESLLRNLMDQDDPKTINARYILALMLERKRTFKPIESKETEDGPLLIYEHAKTGEIFLILDPQLKLSEVESIQMEVSLLLNPPAEEV